jgi:hypothetical protein
MELECRNFIKAVRPAIVALFAFWWLVVMSMFVGRLTS